jgi:hypothetical protein
MYGTSFSVYTGTNIPNLVNTSGIILTSTYNIPLGDIINNAEEFEFDLKNYSVVQTQTQSQPQTFTLLYLLQNISAINSILTCSGGNIYKYNITNNLIYESSNTFVSISKSSDSLYITVCDRTNGIFYSSNSGQTFTNYSASGISSVCMSTSGLYQSAVSQNLVYTSIDNGSTWTNSPLIRGGTSTTNTICTSSNGSIQYAFMNNNLGGTSIFRSISNGLFTLIKIINSVTGVASAISGDGTVCVLLATSGSNSIIYTTNDSWTSYSTFSSPGIGTSISIHYAIIGGFLYYAPDSLTWSSVSSGWILVSENQNVLVTNAQGVYRLT